MDLGWHEEGSAGRRRRHRIAVATLGLALLPAVAFADALRIDALSIRAESDLTLTSGASAVPFAKGGQSAFNGNALLAPPSVSALANDGQPGSPPPGLSYASAQLSNAAVYSDRISVVNDYPQGTPHLSLGQATNVDVTVSTDYRLSVSALVPDAPLDLDIVINAARLRAQDYYGAGRLTLAMEARLEITFDFGPLQTVWQHDAMLRLQATSGSGYTFQSTATIDTQGIGQPAWTFDNQPVSFVLSAQATAPLFTGHLDFGRLQPGHSFQLVYTSHLSAFGTLTYPGAASLIDMALIDPLTLGGTPQPPITLAGLTLPAAIPEPAAWQLLSAGFLLPAWRRRAKA